MTDRDRPASTPAGRHSAGSVRPPNPAVLVVYSGGPAFDWERSLGLRGVVGVAIPSHEIELVPPAEILPALTGTFTHVIVTSRNACDAVFRDAALGERFRQLTGGAEVMAVSATTARHLRDGGVAPTFTPADGRSKSILDALPARLEGLRFLLPRGDDADPDFPAALTGRGAEVVDLVVYRKIPHADDAPLARALASPALKAFAATSPNAVSWLFDHAGEAGAQRLRRLRAAAIGPTTAHRLHELGKRRVEIPPHPSLDALAEKLAELVQ
jgi:uroporphyrinogen-III synthase